MSKVKDNPFQSRETLYNLWVANDGRCTGTRTNGKPCRALCDQVTLTWFCPGLSDRCYYHRDEMVRRSRDLALIAARSGADPVESLQPPERKKIRGTRKAERSPARRSASSSVEPTSRRANGATGHHVQLTFAFAASPAAKQPPGFEPGPRVVPHGTTKSKGAAKQPPGFRSPTAVDIKKGENN